VSGLLEKLAGLRAELADLAFALDREGSPVAADVAMTTAARVGELCEEFSSSDFSSPAVRNGGGASLND
jgi:hypothetical protein